MLNDFLSLPIVTSAMWLLLCACLFGFLQSLFPLDTTRRPIRRDVWMDIGYWMLGPTFYGAIGGMLIAGGFTVLFAGNMEAAIAWSNTGAPWVADWPLWLQALGVLIVTDISLYWTHRLFHSNALWRYHAIHHAPETLDWLHAVRFHPVNIIGHTIFANALALWVGFPPAVRPKSCTWPTGARPVPASAPSGLQHTRSAPSPTCPGHPKRAPRSGTGSTGCESAAGNWAMC